MIFEKPGYQKKSSIIDFLGYTALVILVSSYATYAVIELFGLGGQATATNAKFLDVVNGAAQIATAAAFLLAVHQYRKSIKQQRQLAIAAEAKSQIAAMTEISKSIRTGDNTSIENISDSLSSLVSFAVSFDELYKAMDEDLHRAMIRMQWQNMYFGNLLVTLNKLDLYRVLWSKFLMVGGVDTHEVFREARKSVAELKVLTVFEEFNVYEAVLNHPQICEKYSLVGQISSLDQFVFYFFNDSKLNDLLFGLMNRPDIRAHAPFLAAAKPSPWAFEKHV
ncbi:hypothetical protein ABOC32_10035 [Pseudomonas sp. WOUb67]|uniref:hypothetical protein n=1 Tax=Pseudomonas sp. WOUb67 TaxID=3161136 RepID=UPI003CE90525